jgi:hypothetical protein
MHEIAWVLFLLFLSDGVRASLHGGPPATAQGRAAWSTRSETPQQAEADTFFCLYDVLTRLHPFYMFELDMSHILTHTRACLRYECVLGGGSERGREDGGREEGEVGR